MNISREREGYGDEERGRFWIWVSLKEMERYGKSVCVCARTHARVVYACVVNAICILD